MLSTHTFIIIILIFFVRVVQVLKVCFKMFLKYNLKIINMVRVNEKNENMKITTGVT